MPETPQFTAKSEASQVFGRALRSEVPRKSLGALGPRPTSFDAISILEDQAIGRVPDLVPLRYERMAASRFSFLRGAAAVMAADLMLTPSTGLTVQICGDAHVSNFGVFASPERRLTFDVNDFDETLPGPFEFDVKRMVASLAVAMADQGLTEADQADAVRRTAGAYRESMGRFANQGTMEVWFKVLDVKENIELLRSMFTTKKGSPVDSIIAKADRSNAQRAYAKLTTMVDGVPQFIADPPTVVPLDELLAVQGIEQTPPEVIAAALEGYRGSLLSDRSVLLDQFTPVDMARKVVGVGSVGTRCFLFLLLGRDYSDPLILQIKEAMPSVFEAHLGAVSEPNSGARVVAGQRLMQTTPDLFLGHTRQSFPDGSDHDFYFRQFHDMKASADLTATQSAKNFAAYGEVCAWTLARAHARSGDRLAVASYLGTSQNFDNQMVDWAFAYAERNAADYASFLGAIESGRLPTASSTEL